MARPVRCERHGGEHGEHVDDDDARVEGERNRGAEAGQGPDEMDDEQDPLAPVPIADDGDERRHQRARDHPGEEDETDSARTVRFERHDAQRDDRGPLRCMEASPRQLGAAKRGVLPELSNSCQSPADATAPHAHEPKDLSGSVRRPGIAGVPRRAARRADACSGTAQAAAAAGWASTARRNCPV